MINKLKRMNAVGISSLLLSIILILILVFVTVSYAYWSKTIEQTQNNVVQTTCFSLNFTEGNNTINLSNSYPMSESSAMSINKYYQFTITNTCVTDMYYNVTLNTSTNSGLDDSLNYKLVDESDNIIGPKILGRATQYTDYNNKSYTDNNGTYNIVKSYILTTGNLAHATMNDDHTQIITPGGSKTYKLYLWIDENITDVNTMNKTFSSKVIVTSASNDRKIVNESERKIKSLNTLNQTIASDRDGELRFIGSNPNNYVSFNGENNQWRIIGLFDGRLKLVRNSIGNYSYDTSKNDINIGAGVNSWNDSDLMKLLNPGYDNNSDLKCKTNTSLIDGVYTCGSNSASDYEEGLINNSLWWNSTSGSCYNGGNKQNISCDFSSTGLKTDAARNMIDSVSWNLGSNNKSENIWDGRMTASYLYNFERSSNNGKQCVSGNYCTDQVSRQTKWQGKVGLIYPSDYAYATGGGTTNNRNICLINNIGSTSTNPPTNWVNTYTDCKDNNWLLNTNNSTTISPYALYSGSHGVFYVSSNGYIDSTGAFNANSIRPVIYLKPEIVLDNGAGTTADPFTLKDTSNNNS